MIKNQNEKTYTLKYCILQWMFLVAQKSAK